MAFKQDFASAAFTQRVVSAALKNFNVRQHASFVFVRVLAHTTFRGSRWVVRVDGNTGRRDEGMDCRASLSVTGISRRCEQFRSVIASEARQSMHPLQ
jgi:cation diffusion facilitator CzcD-associated flavoprotein CzcO